MISYVLLLLWDIPAARLFGIWAVGVGVTYLVQPQGREWWEKLLLAIAAGLPGAVATLPSTSTARVVKEAEQQKVEFQKSDEAAVAAGTSIPMKKDNSHDQSNGKG